ncbi:YchJ family protein [Promicromonospora sukumoe]|uniref:YchJ family protein n=1 Tax=Promicromonospora sukumoe TaxID=88382 RepID=UPI00038201C5|nr:YchJ family protein [Promicromonospora sukumoe]
MHDDDRCPCLSGDTYGACCGRYHSGAATAPTAEALMRSRYSAFAVGDDAYLLATWAPQTRPDSAGVGDEQWRRLDIHRTERGGPFDTSGVVEFTAFYRYPDTGVRGSLHETSRFVRTDGRWFYVDGDREASDS